MRKCKRSQTKLPRLTVLSMSHQELVRFVQAAEKVAAAAADLSFLVDQLTPLVDRLEKRSAAAKKANTTRNNVRPPNTDGPAPAAP